MDMGNLEGPREGDVTLTAASEGHTDMIPLSQIWKLTLREGKSLP